jgi:hypothetical protein
MDRLGAFQGCDDCLDLGDGSVRTNRMSPVGVQIEIGAIHVHAKTIIQQLLLSIGSSLNVESGLHCFVLYHSHSRSDTIVMSFMVGNELL